MEGKGTVRIYLRDKQRVFQIRAGDVLEQKAEYGFMTVVTSETTLHVPMSNVDFVQVSEEQA